MSLSEWIVVAAGGQEGLVHVTDAATGTAVTSWKGSGGVAAGSLSLGPSWNAALSASRPVVCWWHWKREGVFLKTGTPTVATALALSPDGAFLVVGDGSGKGWIWATASGALLKSWDAHFRAVKSVVWSPDGSWVATGGADASVKVWTLPSIVGDGSGSGSGSSAVEPWRRWSDASLAVNGLAVGTGGRRLYCVSADQTFKVYDVFGGLPLTSVLFPAPLEAVAVDLMGTKAYLGASNGRVYVCELFPSLPASGSLAVTPVGQAEPRGFKGHEGAITSLSVSVNGALVLSGSRDGTARLWDAATGQVLRMITSGGGIVSSVAFVPADLGGASVGKGMKSVLPPLAPLKKYVDDEASSSAPVTLVPPGGSCDTIIGAPLHLPSATGPLSTSALAAADAIMDQSGPGTGFEGHGTTIQGSSEGASVAEVVHEAVTGWRNAAGMLVETLAQDV